MTAQQPRIMQCQNKRNFARELWQNSQIEIVPMKVMAMNDVNVVRLQQFFAFREIEIFTSRHPT